MLKINKQTITLTKGDDASLRLVPRYKDRTEYVLTEGDRAVFRIKFGHTLVELDCTLNLETNKIVANITPNDTKDFNPGIYRYEAELITSFGFHYTFIADQTFILGQEYEQRITSTSNGNGTTNGNLPEIDGIVDGEPVVYGDIQPTNPMMDYEELNHLPKLNNITIKGSHDNAYYGIPTKTSDLENDSDFVSDDEYVHTDNNYDDTAKNAVDALGTASTYDVPESGNASNSQVVKGDDSRLRDNRDPNPHTHSKADITDFPTNVSAFNNDSGFITNTVNNLANYYLKSETYTRAEVEQLIAAIKQGKFEIVAELPASGDANVIYLVPKSTAQTSNSYDEYVYINNAWEKIGDTDIDLSGYVTDDELATALQSYLTTSAFNTAIASYYTKTETDNLLANKVDKVAGKGLSTNDYDNTAKGIVDGVTSALNDKVDKVQGKGLSTNDYDNTAKGIVDGVTNALAGKVDKENGKGLSTEDYTTAEKSKLGGISDNAKKVASSSTNGHIEIDDVDTTVYDDAAVQTAIENIEDELSTDYATVEGNPINFTTKSAQNAKSTILTLEPIQDLHGYDYPWVGGAGKNLLPMTVDEIKSINSGATWTGNSCVYDNVTFTLLTDNSNNLIGIKANGIPDEGKSFRLALKNSLTSLIGKTIIGNGCPASGSSSTYVIAFQGFVRDGIGILDTGEGTGEITVRDFTSFNTVQVYIKFYSGVNIDNIIFYPMIRLATETDATFAPYKNECPISGRTEIGILGCGKNLLPLTDRNVSTSDYTISIQNGEISITKIGTWAENKTYDLASFTLPIGEYKINGCGDFNRQSNKPYCTLRNASNNAWIANLGDDDYTLTVTDSTFEYKVQLFMDKSLSLTGKITPMLRKSSNTNTYEPYTESTDLTISLGQTVYGGTLDVENGVLVVDYGIITIDDYTIKNGDGSGGGLSWYDANYDYDNSNLISSHLQSKAGNYGWDSTEDCVSATVRTGNIKTIRIYSSCSTIEDLKTKYTGLQVCYPLATPITINLTPHTINLLKGINNISVDDANATITLTYRDGSVATLGDLTSAVDSLDGKIDQSKILTDTVTGDKYILVVSNGVLDIQQISN